MKNIVVFSLLAVLLLSFMWYKRTDDGRPLTRGEVVYELLGKINKIIQEKYKLSSSGTVVGMPKGVVQVLGLDFQIHRHLNQEEARRLLIDCAELFVSMVNADKEVSSYLEDPPFKVANINIGIFVTDTVNPGRHPNLGRTGNG